MKYNVTDIEFDFDDDYAEESKLTFDEEIAMEREDYDVQNAELSMRLYDPELTETIGFYNK